ncbi:hypothetical protein [Clostridium sp.]|uniref:hypothetical protein n=1 Tax=Clostridium sp. TaxID=1506 RepID=UPI002610F66D|nr:hypothetical protein [Clostridium sp.]
MPKLRKVLFIISFISMLIGGFVGFFMVKSGVGKIRVIADIDIFSIFMLFLLIIVTISAIYDVYKISKSQKQFGITKFTVIPNTRNRSRNILVFLILDTILVFAISLISREYKTLPLAFIVLISTIISGLHGFGNNGINENGVMYCGVYYSWSNIKYCRVESETLLEIIVSRKLYGRRWDDIIKFNFDSKHKDDINNFLSLY